MVKIENLNEEVEFSYETIFNEIIKEREFQQKIGYTKTADDECNGPSDWVAYITRYSTRWFPSGFCMDYMDYSNKTMKNFRKSMIKTAALAVAAIEWTDRELERRNA